MFANINDVYLYVQSLLNKNQSGSISGNEFNTYINAAQQEYLRIKLGLPEEYQLGMRESRQQFQATQSNSDSLRPFIVSKIVNKSGNGFDFPNDFAAWGNGDYLYVVLEDGVNNASTQPVNFVTLGERATILNDYNLSPTLEYPIATYIDNQVVIDPKEISKVQMIYVKYPTTPKWGFVVNDNDQEIYDPNTSVQLSFPNLEWQNIAHLTAKYAGIQIRDESVVAPIDNMIKQGQ